MIIGDVGTDGILCGLLVDLQLLELFLILFASILQLLLEF